MSLFGWCATGHHKFCRVSAPRYSNNGETMHCECECHESTP